jgi:predicted NBD/HSP70 family sugar kinase
VGIGLGVPGAVADDGVVVASAQLGWAEIDLRDQLEDVYRIPTHVAGDAEVAAVAEFGRTGSAPASSMLYVKVDDRIAVSAILGGHLHRPGRWGGELTHLTMPGLAGPCDCGRVGCLATEVSVISVLGPEYADLGTEERRRLAADTGFDAGHAGRVLGEALAPLVGSFQIDRVVIGGELSEWPGVVEGLADGVASRLTWAPEVARTTLGDASVVLGAAGMVLSSELGVVWT